jgi:hypothetical protein
MNSTGKSSMPDIEVSVWKKLLEVVIWFDKCGVITNETDFSTFLFVTCSSFYNKTVFGTKKRN